MPPRPLPQLLPSTRPGYRAPARAGTFALAFFLALFGLLLWGAMHDTAHAEDAVEPAPSATATPVEAGPEDADLDAPIGDIDPPATETSPDTTEDTSAAGPVEPLDATPEPPLAEADMTDADAAVPAPHAPARRAFVGGEHPILLRAAAHTAPAVHQCNADTYPTGAGWEASCVITVENTLGSDGSTHSRVTTTWCLAEAGVLPPEGCTTDVVTSNQLVSSVDQCNGILAGGSNVTCRVEVVNNVPSGTPTTGVTVNQCVGSGQGGVSPGGPPTDCDPVDSSTSGATVTQCNGSANGGGGPERVQCSVNGAVTALPVTVNQCNGSTAAGSTVTCAVSYTNNFAAAAITPTPTPTPSATATPVPATSSGPVASGIGPNVSFTPGTPGDSSTSTARSTAAPGPAPSGGTATSLAATGPATSMPRLLTTAAMLLFLGGLLLAGARRRQAV